MFCVVLLKSDFSATNRPKGTIVCKDCATDATRQSLVGSFEVKGLCFTGKQVGVQIPPRSQKRPERERGPEI